MNIGQSIPRREDQRFLTGRGRYVDDVAPANTAYAAFLRSPHPHARIVAIDISRAKRVAGILLVVTGEDWARQGLGGMPCVSPVHFSDGRRMNEATRPILACGKARHVGDTVAAVVAESRHAALEAVEAIDVTYETLPFVTDVVKALEPGAPVVHERFKTNLTFEAVYGDRAKTEQALADSFHVETIDLINNRITANSMEPRTYLGIYDPADDRYTLYSSNQAPHLLRNWLAEESLKIPEHKIRVVAPDLGGGFGMKVTMYPEEPFVLWASKLVARPVRWTSSRSEGLMTDCHARDHATRCRMGFDCDGGITALAVDTVASMGAYVSAFGPSIPGVFYARMMSGPYTNRNVYVHVRGAYTNTVPTEAYRGASRPEALYVIERLLESGARKLGIDVCEMRIKNFIPPTKFPYETPTGMRYDSGNLPGLVEKVKKLADYEALRAEQARARASGVHMGIGLASFTDFGGGAPNRVVAAFGRRMGSFEVGTVRVHPSGKVTILAGTQNHGQGHETTYCQIVADRLGVSYEDIELVSGDTDRVAAGLGSWGSRSLTMAGIALTVAADKVQAKCRDLAAHLLECAASDLVQKDGDFIVKGTDKKISFHDVARAAYHGSSFPNGFTIGLDETVFYEPPERNFSSATHLAVVIVDAETGEVTVRNYAAIDDSGRVINPMIVEGQLHGAVAQGFGQAVMEHCVYDRSSGQLLSGSFMDYGMPRATDLPTLKTGFQETLAPGNPLGAKGAGESGTIGAPVAIVNAVLDALAPLGVKRIDMPLTANTVWATIERAKHANDRQ